MSTDIASALSVCMGVYVCLHLFQAKVIQKHTQDGAAGNTAEVDKIKH